MKWRRASLEMQANEEKWRNCFVFGFRGLAKRTWTSAVEISENSDFLINAKLSWLTQPTMMLCWRMNCKHSRQHIIFICFAFAHHSRVLCVLARANVFVIVSIITLSSAWIVYHNTRNWHNCWIPSTTTLLAAGACCTAYESSRVGYDYANFHHNGTKVVHNSSEAQDSVYAIWFSFLCRSFSLLHARNESRVGVCTCWRWASRERARDSTLRLEVFFHKSLIFHFVIFFQTQESRVCESLTWRIERWIKNSFACCLLSLPLTLRY